MYFESGIRKGILSSYCMCPLLSEAYCGNADMCVGFFFFFEMTGYGNTFTWVYTSYVLCFTMFEREFVAAAKDSTATLR